MADDKIDYPTYARDAAELLIKMIIKKKPYGTYHLANSGKVSYYRFVLYLKKISKLKNKIIPVKDNFFPSKGFKSLKTSMNSVKLKPLRSWKNFERISKKPNMNKKFIKKKFVVFVKVQLKECFQIKKISINWYFYKKKLNKNFQHNFDQSLNICKNCGHLQLENFVSPYLLYNNIYANRTSESFLSDNAIKFFKNFLFKVLKKKNRGIVEIGCNDIKLINNLKTLQDTIWY